MDMDIQINITETPENVSINIFENTNLVAVEAQEQVNDINISITDAPDVNITAEDNVDNVVINIGDSTPSGAGHTIQNDGTSLPARTNLNFIGSGVTATDNPGNDSTDVTIPGGGTGGGSYTKITVADLQTAIADGTLTPGGAYLITDAAGTDGGFFTVAPTANSIDPSGVGIFLNADFQAAGDYSGVEGITGIAAGTQRGIWRRSFEQITIPYTNLSLDFIQYSSPSGLLTDGETYTTDGGHTGTIIHDDGAGTITLIPDQALSPGEILTGDTSGNFVTVNAYTNLGFSVGDTITGGTTGATATVVSDDNDSMVVYVTSAGVAFDVSEVIDNGNGTTADMNGAASSPDIAQGDFVIWNLLHWQLVDATQMNGGNPESNTAAYTLLEKTVANVGYITAYDLAEWDRINNWIQYRQDGNGNKIGLTYVGDQNYFGNGFTSVSRFQWGNQNWYSNTLSESLINALNYPGQVYGCNLNAGSLLQGISGFGYINNNTLTTAQITSLVLGDGAVVSSNTLYSDTVLSGSYGPNSSVQSNILENSAQLIGITAGANCSISRNKIGQGSVLGGTSIMADGAVCDGNEIGPVSDISIFSLGVAGSVSYNTISSGYIRNVSMGDNSAINGHILNGGTISGLTLGNNSAFSNYVLTLMYVESKTFGDSINETGKISQPALSNASATIDITGLTTLDWLTENNYVGIINLTSSNPTETIDTIQNFPALFPFQLRPQGFTLTVTGTPISTPIGAGQIALKQSSYTLDGTKGEYIELESDSTNTYLIEKRPVTGLL